MSMEERGHCTYILRITDGGERGEEDMRTKKGEKVATFS